MKKVKCFFCKREHNLAEVYTIGKRNFCVNCTRKLKCMLDNEVYDKMNPEIYVNIEIKRKPK